MIFEQNELNESGITIIETLVAILLNSIVVMLFVASAMSNRQLYLNDIVRVRIAGNLRTATDIMSMNIRQLGENLAPAFPAVEIENGTSGASDVLTIRRGVLNEVLTICSDAAEDSNRIFVSDALAGVPQCVASSVDDTHLKFENYMADHPDDKKLYIYNTVTKTGEFLDFVDSGINAAEYYFDVSDLSADYPAISSNVYILEEFIFERISASNTLVVYKNGEMTEPLSIAFSITDFQAILKMEDSTTLTAFNELSSSTWKEIKLVNIKLTGHEQKFKQEVTYTTNQDVFPRNIMSLINGSA